MARTAGNLGYLARIGRLFRTARDNAGLTLDQVSRVVNISTTQINRLEHANVANPNHESIMTLAELYGIDVRTLRGNVVRPKQDDERARLVSSVETLLRYLAEEASNDQLEYFLTILQVATAHLRLGENSPLDKKNLIP